MTNGPFIHGEKRFFRKPGLSHSGRFAATATKQQKFRPNEPGGRARLFFSFSFSFSFIYFIYFLIEFNYVLTFLKDARERGAHDDCQSPLPGQVGPGLTV